MRELIQEKNHLNVPSATNGKLDNLYFFNYPNTFGIILQNRNLISLLNFCYRFTRDHHLKTHMRLHTGEKPYHCSHCDRQFVQVANLRRHLRVHTGERPYACELCSAKFSDSNQLKAHLLIHKGEKPFECEHCRMRFRRRHHLMHHKCGLAGSITTASSNASSTRSQIGSPSLASDDLDEDIDIDIDVDMRLNHHYQQQQNENEINSQRKMRIPTTVQLHRPLTSPIIKSQIASLTLPLNLSNIPNNLPEQTEPEDLSMSTGMHRSNSHSGGDSPLSQSPSSDHHQDIDDVNDNNDNDDANDVKLNISVASPSTLFLQKSSS